MESRIPLASIVAPGEAPGRAAPEKPGHNPLPVPGERVRHYELIRELGRGGMGTVFLARDTKLGRRVAIKFLHSKKPELTARFVIEARATAQCHHENIVVIHEVDEHDGNPFMVLEFLDGEPLSKIIERGRLSPSRAVDLIVPVARALVRAHEHDIVHRDLKPDNIFVTATGTVKVLDFGIAKLAEAHQPSQISLLSDKLRASTSRAPGNLQATLRESQLTQQGALVGTLPYMSPEQWGADTVDHTTDIWAVGVILFEMVAGRRPLEGRNGWELAITGMLHEPMPGAREACPGLPDDLADIIDRCLLKHKSERIGSAHELLQALEPLIPLRHLQRSLPIDESPYAGLRAFQESDASRFFGRSGEIAKAIARLRNQPLVGVVGPSGVGKSSFVRAGVIPTLKHSGEPWESIVLRPGRQPLTALAHVVAPMLSQASIRLSGELSGGLSGNLSSSLSEHEAVLERLYREPGYFGTVLRNRARGQGQKILLFIDQFEELYTLVGDPRERQAFTACLASVADDVTTPLRVILSVRSDFLDRVSEDPHFLSELTQGLFFLGAPKRSELRDALTQPAEMAQYRFESPNIVEHMLDHLEQTSGALPLLQFAAAKLWDMRDTERKLLTEASYSHIGGIAGALASHADSVVADLPPYGQALARALFLRLITPERTRAVVSLSDLSELSRDPREIHNLVDQLAQARLLVVQSGDKETQASVEIVHESLLQSWPRLRRWLDENQDDAVFLEQLRAAARQWEAKGHPDGLLWRGEAIAEARRWKRRYRGQLPALQQAYLRAAFALADRAARRIRLAVVGLIVFLSLLVAAGAVALFLIRTAEREAQGQAQRAQQAEKTAQQQLVQVRAEEQARREAEAEARTALAKTRQARDDLEHAYGELDTKTRELAGSLDATEKARERQRRLARRAQKSAQTAQRAESSARRAQRQAERASRDLAIILARERERIRRLEEQRGTIIPDIETSPEAGGNGAGDGEP